MFFNLRTYLRSYLLSRIDYQQQVILDHRKIYILPTKEGLFFSLILLLMLLTAINFSNSLIFMLTFLLAGIVIISMLFSQKNLLSICFNTGIAKAVFCKQTSFVPLFIDNSRQQQSLPSSLTVSCGDFKQDIDLLNQSEPVFIALKTTQRGYLHLPAITISSTFPFGLFYSWTVIKLTNQSIVYPQMLENQQNIQSNFNNTDSAENDQAQGIEDFTGLDKYVTGQSLKQVHWKAYAKQQGMYIKNYSGGSLSNKYWFDFNLFDSHIDSEKRLAYLSYLINQAEKNGHSYGLKIAPQKISINTGRTHKHQCLKALALYSTSP